MRILFVTPACHFPSRGATQQDIYATIGVFKDLGHTVALCTLDQPGQDQKVLDDVAALYNIEVHSYRPSVRWMQWLYRACRRWYLFDRSTYAFFALAIDPLFLSFVKQNRPDVIFVAFTYGWPMVAVAHRFGARCIIRSHNVEPLHFWEELDSKAQWNPFNRLRFHAKMMSERIAARLADCIAAISPTEVATYRRMGAKRVELLPLVSLFNHIRTPESRGAIKEKKIIHLFYLGATYSVPFHRRGAEMIIHHIAPSVHAQRPGRFQFHICGGKLPSSLQDGCDGIGTRYEGYVQDLETFLLRMDGGIFPVWSGRGMKQKIFSSLCHAFPVVAPSVALGGYAVRHEQELLIANSIQEFIDAILSLENPYTRRCLSQRAFAWASCMFQKDMFLNRVRSVLS